MRRNRIVGLGVPTLLASALLAVSLWSQERPQPPASQPQRRPNDSPTSAVAPPADPVPFLTAEEAIKTIKLPRGFHVEVVATEPMVENPVALSFDPDGRVWVAEMRSYMPDPDGKGENELTGRISILEDTDGDG
ncbi:MAG TPA: hypothetical protein VH518_02430, partial [Tepidisphaeraceae bacterium]